MLDGLPSGAATRLAALGERHARRGRVRVVHMVRAGIDPLPGLEQVTLPGSVTPWGRARAGRRIAALARQHGAHLVHCGALPLPRLAGVGLMATVHDLRFLDAESGAGRVRRFWARHRLGPNLDRARRIIVVSQTTGDEIVARQLAPSERVVVIPNAATPGLTPIEDPEAIAVFRRRAELNARYLLAIGPLTRHKNIGLLLDTLTELTRNPATADVSLVLAGRLDSERALLVMRRAKRLGLTDRIRIVGPLDVDELSVVLTGADALVVASTREGFGIPMVDGQRFGVPVVAVEAGALPEVGAGAIWLARDDAGSFGAAVTAAITPGTERTARLEAGRRAAARWSWEASAEALEALWIAAR
jgi:glycosyltransferase involved in cell wall biosynthesis